MQGTPRLVNQHDLYFREVDCRTENLSSLADGPSRYAFKKRLSCPRSIPQHTSRRARDCILNCSSPIPLSSLCVQFIHDSIWKETEKIKSKTTPVKTLRDFKCCRQRKTITTRTNFNPINPLFNRPSIYYIVPV